MKDEATESLPSSPPSTIEDGDGNGEGEPEGDGTASTVLRRTTTGCLEMGNFCEHRELEGEASLLLEGDCEDFKAHGSDLSLEVDLAVNESRGADSGREEGEEGWQRVQGAEGESGNLELERVDSESCEANPTAEMCEGSIDNSVSVDVVNDCGVQAAETGCPVVLGVEEETEHQGSEQAADVGVLEDLAGREVEAYNLRNGVTDYVAPTDNENGHVKLATLPENAEERCQGILGSGRTGDVGISQDRGFDYCQPQSDSADDGIADRRLAVVEIMKNMDSVVGESLIGDRVLGRKDIKLGYTESLEAEDASESLGLVEKSEVDTLQPVPQGEHDRFTGSSPSRKFQGNCLVSSACEKVYVSRNINADSTHRFLGVGNIGNVVSVDNGTKRGESFSGRKEGEDQLLGFVGNEEEIGHIGPREASMFEASNSISEEEHDEFPGLSPLRTLGGGDFACSVFGIGSEAGFLSAGVFDSERVRNGCEDSELLVSPRLVTDYPLVKTNRLSRTTDGDCYPLHASQNCEEPCTVKRCKELHCFKAEKVHFSQCNLNTLCSDGVIENGKEFCLSIDRSLPLQYLGSQKEHCEDNISGHYHKEISDEEEVNRSMQCSPEEVAPCITSKDLALRKSSNLCMSAENFLWTLSSSSGFQGTEADSFIGTSSCCSNVNSSHEAERDSRSRPTIVLRRSNPKRGASLRNNLADGNYNQVSRTRNGKRNGKKAVDINSAFLLSTIRISDKLKRKRSCPHRRSRPSVWGPVENLIKIFEKNVKLANYVTDEVHFQNKKSKKGRSMAESKRQPKSWKDVNFQGSSAEDSAVPDQPVCPVVTGLPTSDCRTKFGNFNEVESKHKLSGNELAAAVKALKRDKQLGDKDMDSSLTQDASGEVVECAGVSSQMSVDMSLETVRDRNSLDPGTSPDSDVYHPILDVGITTSEGNHLADQAIETRSTIVATIDSATLANRFCGLDRKEHVLESVSEDGQLAAASTFSRACEPSSFPPLNLCAKARKGNMNDQLRQQPCLLEDLSIAERSHVPDNFNKDKKSSRSGKSKQKKRDSNKNNETRSEFIKTTTQKGSKCKNSTLELCVSETAELQCFKESMEAPDGVYRQVLGGQVVRSSQSEALQRTAKAKGQKLLCGMKSGGSKDRRRCQETAGRRRQNAHRKMGIGVQNSVKICSAEEVSKTADLSREASDHVCFPSGTVEPTCSVSSQWNYKTTAGSKTPSEDASSLVMTPAGDLLALNESKAILEQPLLPQVAWVLCDDCEKWRCISVELANMLEETKCKWTCKDNTDKAFADCSIPQEKTNAQINAELGISDEEDPLAVKAINNNVGPPKLADVGTSQRASWIPIKSNLFLHRSRKTQTIDEIMVCHCRPLGDGHRGCGDQCLNRMLNIECVRGTCPCQDLCSNQRFQKRKYAKFKWFRCGKKGYGLQLQENASQGQFLIEYVGEVLDLATYEARQRYYAARGQKHFYFMTLNGGEVIDACAKGNLGRFINHSCEPNCRTEKWMVNGEVCIGLFAIRDIKKGEEVTFDYNYVRVFGAAAKKCVCGSSECRGYIGGDPLNSEIIVQGDSDEDDIEPTMIREYSSREQNLNYCMSKANDGKHKQRIVEGGDIIGMSPPAMSEPKVRLESSKEIHGTVLEVNGLDISLQSLDCIRSEDTVSGPVSGIPPLRDSEQNLNTVQYEENDCKAKLEIQKQEISVPALSSTNEVPSDSVSPSKKSMANLCEERPNTAKPRSVTKSSQPRNTIKRGRSSVKHLVSQKTKILTPTTSHSEGVEGKLNELLDGDGGISKKKDATRGYLKLLFVTAAEGDVRGYAFQSTRDLSLILDAILKTKSRKVLVDIINKNGLQMLHNIIKQNRHHFNRIPIIRKLLKVLEFLALTGILTTELINKDPPCNGMESFKDSILELANHNDRQVHRTAREFRDKWIPHEFRDKWIPRNIRRVEPSDKDGDPFDRQLPCRSWIQSSKFKCQQVHAARDTDASTISAADHPLASPSELDTGRETSSHSQRMTISAPVTDSGVASATNPRKRKSRWDHASDITSADRQSLGCPENQIWDGGPKFMKCTLSPSEEVTQLDVSKQMCGFEREGSFCGEVASQDLMQLDHEKPGFIDKGPPGFVDDERPPGFLDSERSSGPIDGKRPPGFFDDERHSRFVADGPPGFDDEGPPGFADEEAPPGFESLPKNQNPQFSSEAGSVTGEVFTAHPQEIYLSHMPMAYGIPLGLLQQVGNPESGGSLVKQNWTVAAGIPFYPFPPLPPYPRGQPNPRDERRQALPASGAELAIPSTSGGMLADTVERGSRNPRFNGRLRWPNDDCGRRYIRPQRPNDRRYQRCWPHWPPQRSGRGFRSNMRVGPNNVEEDNMRRDFPGGYRPSGGVNNYDDWCSSFQRQRD